MKQSLAYYNKILGKTKYGILFVTLLGVVYSLLLTYSALITERLIDNASADAATGTLSKELIGDITAFGLFIVGILVLNIVYSYLNSKIKARTELDLRARILGVTLSRDYRQIQKYHSGDILNRATNDVNVVVTGLVQSFPEFIITIVRIVSALVVLFTMNSGFAIILLCLAPLTLIATSIYGKKVKKLHIRGQKCEGENRAFMAEAVQNMTVIKACSNENAITDYFSRLQGENYRLKMKAAVLSIAAGMLMFLSVYVLYYVALMWGAYGIVEGAMSFGTLTAMLQLVVQFQSPFKTLASEVNQLYRTSASAERIRELENLDEDSGMPEPVGDFEGLSIRDLCFSYGDSEVIHDLNAEIEKGQFVGIGGPSGIGKSTLLKLIMGLLNPTSGSVSLKGSGDRRGMFSYVPQGNMVLSGTIRDNICFLNGNIPDDKVEEACRTCCLDELIDSLPDGIDTVLGEKGTGLSEGQLQRIAIARAVVMDKKVLLLDEATSALDEETERKIIGNLTRNHGLTVIMVTHHTKLLEKCDKLIKLG